MHFGAQYQTARIDQNVALAAIDPLGTIVATHAADAGRPDGLAVDDARARVGGAPDADTELLAQDGVQVLPRAIQTPQPEVVIGGLPGREFMRQQPPGAATPNDIEDGIQDLAHRMQPWSADTLRWRQQGVQTGKLGIREIGQVGSPQSQTPAILPAKPTRVPVFRQFLVGLLHFTHLTPKPSGYTYPYPDFVQVVYMASAVTFVPEARLDDGYEVETLFRSIDELPSLALPVSQRLFLDAALHVRASLPQ